MLPVTRVAIARMGRGLPDKSRAAWFFAWMVIATGFAWFAWLVVIMSLSDVPMGEALWHWFVFWPMTITGWIIGASDWSNRTGIKLWGRGPGGIGPFADRSIRVPAAWQTGLQTARWAHSI